MAVIHRVSTLFSTSCLLRSLNYLGLVENPLDIRSRGVEIFLNGLCGVVPILFFFLCQNQSVTLRLQLTYQKKMDYSSFRRDSILHAACGFRSHPRAAARCVRRAGRSNTRELFRSLRF